MEFTIFGGQSGIRTRVTVSGKHAFQACAFSHSATCPYLYKLASRIQGMQFFQSCLCEQNAPLTLPRQCALALASAGAAFGRAKIASGDFFTPSTLNGRGEGLSLPQNASEARDY